MEFRNSHFLIHKPWCFLLFTYLGVLQGQVQILFLVCTAYFSEEIIIYDYNFKFSQAPGKMVLITISPFVKQNNDIMHLVISRVQRLLNVFSREQNLGATGKQQDCTYTVYLFYLQFLRDSIYYSSFPFTLGMANTPKGTKNYLSSFSNMVEQEVLDPLSLINTVVKHQL